MKTIEFDALSVYEIEDYCELIGVGGPLKDRLYQIIQDTILRGPVIWKSTSGTKFERQDILFLDKDQIYNEGYDKGFEDGRDEQRREEEQVYGM